MTLVNVLAACVIVDFCDFVATLVIVAGWPASVM